MNTLRKSKKNIGFIFILPWFVGFLVFKAYPIILSLYYSFTDYNFFRGVTTYTLQNYKDMYVNQTDRAALIVTIKYVFMTVPIKLIIALGVALLLNKRSKMVNFFKVVYYLPAILGGSVAIAVLWKAIFNDNGLIHGLCKMVGMQAPKFMTNPFWALFMLGTLNIWQFGVFMLIFLTALNMVPKELYEVASIDGAGRMKQFFYITLPQITPIIFYNIVTGVVVSFQDFNGPFIITRGGPLGSTTLMSLMIYNNAFKTFNMGKASAQSWVLFVLLAIFTALAFITQKYWVYQPEDDGKK